MILRKRAILLAVIVLAATRSLPVLAQNATPGTTGAPNPTAPAIPSARPAAAPPPATSAPTAPTSPPGTKLPPAVIGIVDLQYVLQTSLAARSVLDQVEKQRRAWQVELDKRRNDLVGAQQELDKQRATLAADAFNAKERVLLTQRDELQQDINGRLRQLDDGFGESMRPIQDEALKIIAAIMRERSLNLVLHKQTTIFATTELDLTAEVIQKLDKARPTASFKLGQAQKN